MQGRQLASGLGFPEGPVDMGDGRIVFCDGNTGEMLVWDGTRVSVFATTGGSPWGAILGTDGAVYVTQGGNVPGSGDTSAVSGIQRINPDGSVELLFSEVDGYQLYGPNDLAFGPDGRLYFTDPAGGFSKTTPPPPGYIFALNPDGTGEVVAEAGQTFPNGITVEADGNVVWVESFTRAVRRYVVASGKVEDLCILEDEDAIPDGLKPATNGDLYIATVLTGGVNVVGADGSDKGLLKGFGDYVSNVQFRGSTLYVTDIGGGSGDDASYHGSISRTELDGVEGLPLFPGTIG